MGACQFEHTVIVSKSTDMDKAFQQAVSDSRYENGHGGYTGTLAEIAFS